MRELLISELPRRVFNGGFYRTSRYHVEYDHRESNYSVRHINGRYFRVNELQQNVIVAFINRDDWYDYLDYHQKDRPYVPQHISFHETFGDDVLVFFSAEVDDE